MAILKVRIRRDSSVNWAARDPILDSGEQGLETDTGRYKIGDGRNRWSKLEGFLSEEAMLLAIEDAVQAQIGVDIVTSEDLQLHVDDTEPHPIYDDGPSFLLLYENAKV